MDASRLLLLLLLLLLGYVAAAAAAALQASCSRSGRRGTSTLQAQGNGR
jgi:hypothetical protein